MQREADGTSNYWKDVLKLQSDWIYYGKFHRSSSDSDNSDLCGSNWDTGQLKQVMKTLKNHGGKSGNRDGAVGTFKVSLGGGVSSSTLGTDDILRGFDKFEDKDNIEVDFLIAPESLTDTPATTIVNDLIATAGSTRKDCVVVASPSRAVVTTGTNDGVLVL